MPISAVTSLERGRQPVQGLGPLLGRQRRPAAVVERAAGRAHRLVHVRADGGGDRTDDLFSRGVDDREHVRGRGTDQPTAGVDVAVLKQREGPFQVMKVPDYLRA
jgi:hypothetical protein